MRNKKIEISQSYTRKYVLENEKIDQFISRNFPVMSEQKGEIILIKGNSWKDAIGLANEQHKENCKESDKLNDMLPSWYRDENCMYSLTQMDLIRARLITNANYRAIFYTHLTNEYAIAEKKFKLFQKNSTK